MTRKQATAVEVRPPYTDQLPVKLTREEREEFGAELANRHRDLDDLSDALAAFKTKNKGEVGPVEDRIRHLARCIRDGEEFRAVEVQWTFEFDAKRASLTRLDSGEVVRERAMRPEELQAEIPA